MAADCFRTWKDAGCSGNPNASNADDQGKKGTEGGHYCGGEEVATKFEFCFYAKLRSDGAITSVLYEFSV